ncbi:YcnI family protein [Paenibacillus pinistramenti]|uniref:YcnI family copper-binding membrane protein n=1 Tax=Paenibacillus pinistramenti TaxID=1768003 RepID=UPI0011098EBC|nr:YcnI family protein [Paenibacillus pinistramenti]
MIIVKKSLRLASIPAAMLAFLLLFGGLASAHVTVKPSESAPEAWETYTMKVPNEKDIPTVKVTLKVPEQAELEQYQPVPGWTAATAKDDSGRIKTITWEAAAGGGIEAGQFQQFSFVAKNPSAEGELAWDAYQYYSDGTVVEWTGDEDAESPHSITTITSAPAGEAAGTAGTDSPASSSTDSGAAASDTAADDSGSSSSVLETLTLVISIISLLAALAALWLTIRSGRRKA